MLLQDRAERAEIQALPVCQNLLSDLFRPDPSEVQNVGTGLPDLFFQAHATVEAQTAAPVGGLSIGDPVPVVLGAVVAFLT